MSENSGERLNKNGEKQQVKTETTIVVDLHDLKNVV